MEILNTYIIPVIVVACLLLGFIVKKWIRDVDNRWIPTIVCVVGIGLSVWMNWPSVTLANVVSGALSGLASTGLHQMFTKWLDGGANVLPPDEPEIDTASFSHPYEDREESGLLDE